MDIDQNDIQMLVTRIPKILIESSFTLMKTHPKASFASCSLFFSYIFVPSILWFLIYTVPFIVLITAIAIQTYISINKGRHPSTQDKNDKSPTNVLSSEDAKTANKKYNAKHGQSVRRRKAKVIIAESRPENIQEKETISSTIFTYDPVEKRALIEETPKEIQAVEVNVVNDLVNSSSSPSLVSNDFRSRFNSVMRSQTFGGTATNLEGISSENIDGDDDTRGDERTAVQWSEDDQKNLADLGLSEIERNRRLESLIARRRAQKLLSFQLRKAMMDMGDDDSTSQIIHSIVMPNRSNFLSPRRDHFTPVSAPPELSPVQNPFDLPYEPHEEKPNLTGDSFHQEFLGTDQKDIVSGDILPTDLSHNLLNSHGTMHEVSDRREKNVFQLGEKDDGKRVEQDQSQEAECDDKVEIKDKNTLDQEPEQGHNLNDEDIATEVRTKSVIAEDYNGRISYSSSSEEDEPISRLDKEKILKSLSSPHPRSMNLRRGGGRIDDLLFDFGSSGAEKTKRPESFYFPYDATRHTPSYSIASDLQVEVSEFGSPPLLSDGTNSSPDDVRSLCDGNFEKGIPYSKDTSTTSSQQSRVDADELRSREIYQVSKEDNTGVGFPRVKEETKVPTERVNAQASSNPHPDFISECKVPGDGDLYKEYIEHIDQEQPTTSFNNSSHGLQSKNLPPHEKQLSGTSMTDHSLNSDLHNPQVPSLPPSNPTDELAIDTSSPNLQAHNTSNGRTVNELGNEYEQSYRHEPDEVIDCLRSPEKSRTEVDHPFEDKYEIDKKISAGVNGIHIEDTSKNVDDESPVPHNTQNNKIHGEPQNSASGSPLTLPFHGEVQLLQNNSEENLISNKEVDTNIDLPDQSNAEPEEYLKANIVDESVGEGSQPTFTREAEETLQRMDIPDSLSTEGNYILESTTDTEDDASSIARPTSELRQLVIQPNVVVPEPELLTAQAPTASSTSSSPKSVLNPRFSGDQGNISYISDVVQMENHHSGEESSSSNSSSSPAQNAAPLAENPTTYQPLERTERIQERSNSPLVSTEEATSTSGSFSGNDIHMDSTGNVQKETSETSVVYTDVRNQETNLDTTSSIKEETDIINREGRL